MSLNLEMEVFYPYPPQRVWQVLTNRSALAAWLMENDFEPRLGHKFQFQYSALPELSVSIDCEVIELDEPRRLSYTWLDSMMIQPSIVSWILAPVDGGTLLQLQHKGLRHDVETLSATPYKLRPTHSWQSQLMNESLPPIHRTTTLQIPVGKYEMLDSVILSSFLNGGWKYKLNEKLSQILAGVTTDR